MGRPVDLERPADLGRSVELERQVGLERPVGVGRPADLGRLDDAIPVLEPLAALLPQGLRRGETVALTSRDRSPDYLALALLAGALVAGLWCAAVGVPDLGGVALAELLSTPGTVRTPGTSGAAAGPNSTTTTGALATPGTTGTSGGLDEDARDAALDRLLLVPEPGERWAELTAGLADGVDLLLVRPPEAVPANVGRRVDARLRQGRASGTRHSAAMVVLGSWASARLVLRTAQTIWTGLDGVGPNAGTGHLTGGRGTVVAEGRATAGRPRTVRLWLPAADGAARALIDVQAPAATTARPSLAAVAATATIDAATATTEAVGAAAATAATAENADTGAASSSPATSHPPLTAVA